MTRSWLITIFVLLSIGNLCHAQEKTAAVKFDEYGRIGECDEKARLDNFALELKPTYTGYIVYFGTEGSRKHYGSVAMGYLTESRGVDPEQLKLIDGGPAMSPTEIKLELWVGSADAREPQPIKNDLDLKGFRGKVGEDFFWDEVDQFDEYSGQYLSEQADKLQAWEIVLNALHDIYKQQPDSIVYVVGYNANDAVPGAWRRAIDSTIAKLKNSTIKPNQLKTVYGGLGEITKTEMWIQSKDDPQPVADKGPEQLPSEAVLAGNFYDSELANTRVERAAFLRFAEVLKNHPNTRAVLMVRIAEPEPVEAKEHTLEVTSRSATPEVSQPLIPEEPQPDPIDLLQLVQKWKTELAALKLREDRLLILYGRTDAGMSSSIEGWIVPPGAELPTLESPEKDVPNPDDTFEITQINTARPAGTKSEGVLKIDLKKKP